MSTDPRPPQPAFVLLARGISNQQGKQPYALAAHVVLFWAGYIYGEEAGWRGFLQQVAPGNRLMKAAVVGGQWYCWHLSFVFEEYSFRKKLFFLATLLVGSYLGLLITRRTQSWLPVLGLHFSFSVLTNLPNTAHYTVSIWALGLGWAVLLATWNLSGINNYKSII